MDKTKYLHEDAETVIKEVFGEHTAELFSEVGKNKSDKELILLLKDLLIDYLGEQRAGEIIFLLSRKHDL